MSAHAKPHNMLLGGRGYGEGKAPAEPFFDLMRGRNWNKDGQETQDQPSAAEPQPIGKNDDEEPRKAGIRDSVAVERRKFR